MPNVGVWLVSTMPKPHTGDEENVHDDSNGNMLHFIQNILCFFNILMYLRLVNNKIHRFELHLGEQVLNHPASNHHDSKVPSALVCTTQVLIELGNTLLLSPCGQFLTFKLAILIHPVELLPNVLFMSQSTLLKAPSANFTM